MGQPEKFFIHVLILSFAAHAHAQSPPTDGTMLQYYAQLQADQKKAELLEQKAHRDHDVLDLKKQEAERDVAARKNQIETLKSQQERSRGELEQLSLALKKINGDLDSYKAEQKQLEDSAAATLKYLQGQRQELNDRRTTLEAELRSLENARKKAEHDVYTLAVDIEHFKVEIAKTETRVQEAAAKRAAVEADEVKIRAEWNEVKAAIAEHHKAHDQALAEIADAKKRFDGAHRELQDAKNELVRVEKARNEAVKRSQDEVTKYEKDIAAANKARLVAEAEQIRMETEVKRVQEYSARIKDMRDHNLDMQANAEAMELKSSLAVETARSAHARAMETSDQTLFKKDKDESHARATAAAKDNPSPLDQAGRLWVTTKNCKAYRQANTKKEAAAFEAGRKLLAKDHGKGWIEIMNGSGASVFMQNDCGNFEN